jgi:UDPglucose--hexose-1-phosphate uridylyltransferase
MSELRFNPLLGEWTATATARQDRTFFPPDNYCPLCPTKPGGFPTEIPRPDYDIVAFENKFPTFKKDPEEPAINGDEFYPVRPSKGICEVVVYSPDHDATLTTLPIEQIYKLILVWTDRFRELEARDFIDYVYIFENKGAEVGVTLSHPHGQIYAYPFVPPIIAKELARSEKHMRESGKCLICTIIEAERSFEQRVVAQNEGFVAVIPFFARYPYEVHIYSKRHLQAFTDLTAAETKLLAGILKQLLVAYDALFDRSFPYIMPIHQRPTDGRNYDHYHFHFEFYPPLRSAKKLKYLAGSEAGAGLFINDTLPEEKAAELRSHVRPVEWSDLR